MASSKEPGFKALDAFIHLTAILLSVINLSAASPQGTAETKQDASAKRDSAVRLLERAEVESKAFDAPMRCAIQLALGHAYAAVDKHKAATFVKAAYENALLLPEDDPLGTFSVAGYAIREMTAIEPAWVEDNMPADPRLRPFAQRGLLGYYIAHKNLERALEIYRSADDQTTQGRLGTLLAAIPKTDALERSAVLTQAIGACRRTPAGFLGGPSDLANVLVRQWRELDPRLVEDAIDVLLEQARNSKSTWPITATAQTEHLRFSSLYEFRLFQFVPILRALRPGRADALLREEPNLARVLGRFPEGEASFNPSPKPGEAESHALSSYNGSSSEQQYTADVNRVVSLSEKDPNSAIAQVLILPDWERGPALVAIAQARLHDQTSVAKNAMDAYLKLTQAGSTGTSITSVEIFLQLGDLASAQTALDVSLKGTDGIYRADSDSDDPNKGLKLFWPSTVSWVRAIALAAPISPDSANGVLKRIPDPEVRAVVEIALAGAWLNLPPSGFVQGVIVARKPKQ